MLVSSYTIDLILKWRRVASVRYLFKYRRWFQYFYLIITTRNTKVYMPEVKSVVENGLHCDWWNFFVTRVLTMVGRWAILPNPFATIYRPNNTWKPSILPFFSIVSVCSSFGGARYWSRYVSYMTFENCFMHSITVEESIRRYSSTESYDPPYAIIRKSAVHFWYFWSLEGRWHLSSSWISHASVQVRRKYRSIARVTVESVGWIGGKGRYNLPISSRCKVEQLQPLGFALCSGTVQIWSRPSCVSRLRRRRQLEAQILGWSRRRRCWICPPFWVPHQK